MLESDLNLRYISRTMNTHIHLTGISYLKIKLIYFGIFNSHHKIRCINKMNIAYISMSNKYEHTWSRHMNHGQNRAWNQRFEVLMEDWLMSNKPLVEYLLNKQNKTIKTNKTNKHTTNKHTFICLAQRNNGSLITPDRCSPITKSGGSLKLILKWILIT